MNISMLIIWFVGIFFSLLVHAIGYYVVGKMHGRRIKEMYIFASWGFHIFSSHDSWFVKLFPKMKGKPEFKIGWLPTAAGVDFVKPDNTNSAAGSKETADSELIIDFAGVLANIIVGLLLLGICQLSGPYHSSIYIYNFALQNLLMAGFVGIMLVFATCAWRFYEIWLKKV